MALSRCSSPEILPPDRIIHCAPTARRDSWSSKHVIVEDLSNGQELYPVRVWNSLDKETVKPFDYITGIETFPNYQRTPVICDCEDGCDSNCKCMFDAFDVTGYPDIPYDEKTGRLTIRCQNKWASSHRILWECSAACKCGPDCPSRSAQLGIRFQLEVFQTSKKGWGVRPLRDIPKGSFIAEYAGQMRCAKDEAYEYNESDWYSFDITSEEGVTNFYIDASQKGNIARFINHSCDPNLIAVHVFYDDNNPQMGMHICFYASEDIKEGKELCFDYGNSYWEAKMKQNIGCECGSTKCQYRRGKKRSGKIRRKAKVDSGPTLD
ncbi:putative Histone-lysine N-methyltransferase EHMT2 [Hypsibius exemplaris]|uniref:Histone-lysine N-methyltransferase EHMT2 n=1 Tax=Hypsibius exemplaris TaxID=2072580 RepID=A0A1W0WV78_HYPEX|nr:putative Histone-lysine N-methyltransferase EHMT2 [Hypsibius exemplaris]